MTNNIEQETKAGLHKGLLIIHGGYQSTIIDSQVITHVNEMKEFGILIDIWIFSFTKSNVKFAKERLYKLNNKQNIQIFRAIRPSIPLANFFNALICLYYFITSNKNYKFIHARTDYSVHLCRFIKYFKKIKIVWDCRGDIEDEYRYQNSDVRSIMKLIYIIKLMIIKCIKINAAKISNSALFVSDALYVENYHLLKNKKYSIIPSTASSKIFYFSEKLRTEYRANLGILKDEKVIIYNGSLSPWQCLLETINLFERLQQHRIYFKFLVISPNDKNIHTFINNKIQSDRIIIKESEFELVNAYLNAADYGIMLREQVKLNYVASPVKFSEYCMAGLPVIMNNAVNQSFINSFFLENLIYYDLKNLPIFKEFSIKNRIEIAAKAKKLYARDTYLNDYLTLYK